MSDSDYDIVRSKKDLQAGDHVSMPSKMCGCNYQHHAIVEAEVSSPTGASNNMFKIIHAATTKSQCSPGCSSGF